MSPETEHELIALVSECTGNAISEKVSVANFHVLVIDEATDVFMTPQISGVLTYKYKNGDTEENSEISVRIILQSACLSRRSKFRWNSIVEGR
jgi:hypothetical protein